MRVLVDTNVVLDLLLERKPFAGPAVALFNQMERGRLEGYITATTVTNVFYIIQKAEGREVALHAVRRLLVGFRWCAVNRRTVETALRFDLKDFEDGVQLACATIYQLETIVTRDPSGFAGSPLPVYAPDALLKQI